MTSTHIYTHIQAFEELRFVSLEKNSHTLDLVNPDGHLSPEMDPAVSSAAKILFSKQGNYVQELLLDEAVRIADALSRFFFSTARKYIISVYTMSENTYN